MKITRKQLNEIIQRNLNEAKCPNCGTDGAYIGLNDVECQNKKCLNYDGETTTPVKIARFDYSNPSALYIDDKYVCDPDDKWGDPNTGDFDIESMIDFLQQNNVTHVIDEESFDDNGNILGEWDPQPHPIEDWIQTRI